MRAIRFLPNSLFLLLLLAACSPAANRPSDSPTIALAGCVLSAPDLPARSEAQCGSLAVPEDWSNAAGRQITLKVAVVPAVSRSPKADPLFVLAGGPGQAATEGYPILAGALQLIAQARDIVLVDQRGTGGSNPLRCTPPESTQAALALSVEAGVALLQACPARLGADPALYTTISAVHDLDAARAALGYQQLDLYGVSYGARLALAYVRQYPDRVRTLVLDGVVGPDLYLFRDAPSDGQRSLDLALERCQAEAACRAAFPDVRADLDGIFERLEQQPLPVTLADPVSGEPLEFVLTRTMFASFLFNLLYVPEAVSLLPLGVQKASAGGDFAPLLGLALETNTGIYDGLFYSVTCAEDAPFLTHAATASAAEGAVFGDMSAAFREICAAWPKGPAEGIHEPVPSDVPALLLSGEADPVTPPRYAEQVAAALPNSLHLVAPGMGHGNLGRGCIPRVVADFVEHGMTQGLSADCVAKIQPPPFFLRLTGPNP